MWRRLRAVLTDLADLEDPPPSSVWPWTTLRSRASCMRRSPRPHPHPLPVLRAGGTAGPRSGRSTSPRRTCTCCGERCRLRSPPAWRGRCLPSPTPMRGCWLLRIRHSIRIRSRSAGAKFGNAAPPGIVRIGGSSPECMSLSL